MSQPTSFVYLVDDDPSIRSSLSRLLRAVGYEVATFESAGAFLAEASPDDRGCLVLDITMPVMDGLTLQEKMNERGLDLPIVFITGFGNVSASVKALKGGAVDFLEKPFDDDELLEAIELAIERGEAFRSQRDARSIVKQKLDELTPREYQILTHVVAGFLNKVTARELDVSEKTVKVHRGRVMTKMGARSLADLVRMAETAGVEPATRQKVWGAP